VRRRNELPAGENLKKKKERHNSSPQRVRAPVWPVRQWSVEGNARKLEEQGQNSFSRGKGVMTDQLVEVKNENRTVDQGQEPTRDSWGGRNQEKPVGAKGQSKKGGGSGKLQGKKERGPSLRRNR